MPIVTIPGSPGMLKKNNARILRRGHGYCHVCKQAKGAPFIVPNKLPASLMNSLRDRAFSSGIEPAKGMVMVGVLAHWPKKWDPSGSGRAPGRPQGDVDAPVSGVLDALSGVLYQDDAQVALLVAVNAKAAKGQERIEVSVRPLSSQLLAMLEAELGLGFTSATLSVGEQGKLI